MIQNVDNLQSATVITNPTNLKGRWTQIECLTDLTNVVVVDKNLTANSEADPSSVYVKGAIRIGHYKEITCTGTVKLYA
ncbi:MAG: hypothetical protein GY775_05190 [Candidatus Scalindua sp.]|nr:hypothetical protein [Candidatus Scalindua sp.]